MGVLHVPTPSVKEKKQSHGGSRVPGWIGLARWCRTKSGSELTRRRGLKERLGPRHVRSRSGSPDPRRGRSESPKKKGSMTPGVGPKEPQIATGTLKACHHVYLIKDIQIPASKRRYTKVATLRRQDVSESEVAPRFIGSQ
ncbi:hypothetical protein Tco_0158979 [Tanacetum coccineum]